MMTDGFAGQTLHICLTDERMEKRPLDMDDAKSFGGGLGICIKLAHERMRSDIDPLAPENPIIIGVGPLVGTNLPGSSRVYGITRLPASRSVGWCGAGGMRFGCAMKNAGYDHLIIEGGAAAPVYIEMDDEHVHIRDARFLWGKGIEETCELLWRQHGPDSGILAIGPSGENRAYMAMAFVDRISTLGRGGFGAVMGAKNLKAILMKGTGGVRVADRKRYKELNRALMQEMRNYPYLKEWQEMGMVKSFPLISKEVYMRMKKRRIACISCPIGCKDLIEVPDGPFRGLLKYTSSVVNLYTPVIYGFTDYRESIKCMATIDEMGLDMFEFFGVMAFAARLVKEGIISEAEATPGIRIDSLDSMEAWARRVAYREGLGDVLAGGFPKILKTYGDAAVRLAPPLIKHMQPYAGPGAALPWNLFGTMELGQAMDPRGPHVGSGGSPTYFAKRPLETFPKHLKRMGVPEDALARIIKDGDLNVGRLLRYSHRWFTVLGSLGLCARAGINRFYSAQLCAELYEAVTGIETTETALMERADRAWTLLKKINMEMGMDRKDDGLPSQWFEPGGFKSYETGKALQISDAEQMVSDYYDEWGWDPATGKPRM